MKLRRVPPDSIKVPEVRVTARFDEEMWEQFKSSIKAVGAIAPIICVEVNEELVLVDGLHRLVEAKRAGEKLVNVAVMPGDEVDVYTKNIFLDHLRGKPPVSEMINVIALLTTEYKLDSEGIAAKTGLTRDYVEKLQRLSELTPACRASLDEGKIGVGQAFELTRITDPITQETVLHQLELYRWKVPDLREYIDSVLAIQAQAAVPPPPGGTPQKYLLECFYCHEKKPITEIANPHTCRSCTYVLLAACAQAGAEAKAEAEAQKSSEG
jgi:ParB-like chromosome segregation protein Spo0J